MEPENPTFPTPPPQPAVAPISAPIPKKKSFILILHLVLIVVIALVVGYLFLQVQSLTKQLSQSQVQVQPSPTPTVTTDPTANWKTYQHSDCGNHYSPVPFSVKIPNNWTETIVGSGTLAPQYKYQNKDTNFEITCGSGFGGGGCGLANQKIQDKFFANGTEINGCLERNITNKTVNLWLTYLTLGTDKPTFSFTASAGDTNDNVNLINQILSTFKFTD